MSKRDERLAARYAAKGMESATETARKKTEGRSRVPDDAGGPVIDKLRAFNWQDPVAIPLSDESRGRAAAYRKNLPPLPPAS
jgi:hypothetical protein